MYDSDRCSPGVASLGFDVVGTHVLTGETVRFGTYQSPRAAQETARSLAASESMDLLQYKFKAVQTF